ncbi:MAG: threonylcarbamoyl-AMP synthase [Oscillospiraceae bacterium]|nr:threonylcarbamoyl-AMP synthase [Oscillospiraceae bacterium]
METLLAKPSQQIIEKACTLIKDKQVVALPTETVYGLFADATSSHACENIFKAKERPMDNPLIVHICDYDMLHKVAAEVTEDAMKLAETFWPGPLTIILKKSDIIPTEVSAGLDTVGIRMPRTPVILEVISKTGLPLAGPSANRSGRPSPTNAQYVYEDLKDRIPLIIDDGSCDVGVESTVVSLAGEKPIIFRPGYVTQAQIAEVLGREVELSKGITEELMSDDKVLSPGLKHKHYAPKCEVTIINASFEKYKEKVEADGAVAFCFEEYIPNLNCQCVPNGKENDSASQAVGLFTALRHLDEIGAEKAYAIMPTMDDVGLAVYNRLLRSAEFRVVNL